MPSFNAFLEYLWDQNWQQQNHFITFYSLLFKSDKLSWFDELNKSEDEEEEEDENEEEDDKGNI